MLADDKIVRVSCLLGTAGASPTASKPYESEYAASTLAGEFVRNICVNLGIDPDTHDGVTRNASVYLRDVHSSWQIWPYRADHSISAQGLHGNVELLVCEITGSPETPLPPVSAAASVDMKSKRSLEEVAPFALDEDLAIAESLDCSTLDDDTELVVPPS
jgi:hypothetical protein